MRVIAGLAKGFTIKTFDTPLTRPATDRVKENVFNILPDLSGFSVIDIFAGSGSLGIEALSRGAAYAKFVEDSPEVARVIENNLAHVAKNLPRLVSRDSEVFNCDADTFLTEEPEPVDLIFCDPPFPLSVDHDAMKILLSMIEDWLVPGGILVYRQQKRVPSDNWPLPIWKERVYGINRVLMFRRDT